MSKNEDDPKLPSERVLKSLLRLTNQTKEKTGSLSGELGQAIRDAVERHNLHAAAFKLSARLKRMDPVKLRAFLDNFDAYRDIFKLDDMKASDMFEDDQTAATAKSTDGKVTPIRGRDSESASKNEVAAS